MLSPGARNIPIVHSVENDSFFQCYSVVDERSAAFFAIGISLETNEPVAVSCTSSTASCNYLSGLTEAYYRHIPIVTITADRDPYYIDQMESLLIKQQNMYQNIMKKSVQLPIVNNAEDFWYCERLVNEALLELDHHGKGPVHINIPTVGNHYLYDCKVLPEVRKMERLIQGTQNTAWTEKLRVVNAKSRILIFWGENIHASSECEASLAAFAKCHNCVIIKEHMGNISLDKSLNPALIINAMSVEEFDQYGPDLIISTGGDVVSGTKAILTNWKGKCEHWLIDESGKVTDVFRKLTTIFECSPKYFFDYFSKDSEQNPDNNSYFNLWKRTLGDARLPEIPFSNAFAIKSLMEKVPANSNLHLSILNSVRLAQYFQLNPDVKVFSNLGAFGIDGCMSTFLGQASVSKNLNFLIILYV